MARNAENLELTTREISAAFSDPDWAARFPPVLTVDQVTDLLQIPKQTVYDWSSRGLLHGCCRRTGKHLRFFRDRLLSRIFNEGLNSDG